MSNDLFRLDGQTALVTGAGSGIGQRLPSGSLKPALPPSRVSTFLVVRVSPIP